MTKFIPQLVEEASWVRLSPDRDYAVRADGEEPIHLRLGPGQGVYLSILAAPSGRMVHGVDFESGDQTLLAKMPDGQPITVGRISECAIKIMHAIVSRKHVELRLEGNIVVVRDLGSTNGTFLGPDLSHFDIQKYLDEFPIEDAENRTLDDVHERFGPTLDDFLKRYSSNKDKPT